MSDVLCSRLCQFTWCSEPAHFYTMRSLWDLDAVMEKPRKSPEQDLVQDLVQDVVRHVGPTFQVPLGVAHGLSHGLPHGLSHGVSQHLSINVPFCPQVMLAAYLLRGELPKTFESSHPQPTNTPDLRCPLHCGFQR